MWATTRPLLGSIRVSVRDSGLETHTAPAAAVTQAAFGIGMRPTMRARFGSMRSTVVRRSPRLKRPHRSQLAHEPVEKRARLGYAEVVEGRHVPTAALAPVEAQVVAEEGAVAAQPVAGRGGEQTRAAAERGALDVRCHRRRALDGAVELEVEEAAGRLRQRCCRQSGPLSGSQGAP